MTIQQARDLYQLAASLDLATREDRETLARSAANAGESGTAEALRMAQSAHLGSRGYAVITIAGQPTPYFIGDPN